MTEQQKQTVIEILKKVLGDYTVARQGIEYIFFCPVCKHYKRKFSVNIENGCYHCWVCQDTKKTRGRNIAYFIRKISDNEFYYNELNKIYGKIINNDFFNPNDDIAEPLLLPKDFKSLIKESNSPLYRHALNYLLKKRKLKLVDIFRYNLMYAEYGPFSNMIIIPSYDSNFQLNYYLGRSFYDNVPIKYRNCNISRNNIIGFESFVNFKFPLVLVEGPFDAITLRNNTVPLFGKLISKKLLYKIVENRTPILYIFLDSDAIRESIHIFENLEKYEIETRIVLPEGGKDANELGYDKSWELIKKAKKFTFSEIIKTFL